MANIIQKKPTHDQLAQQVTVFEGQAKTESAKAESVPAFQPPKDGLDFVQEKLSDASAEGSRIWGDLSSGINSLWKPSSNVSNIPTASVDSGDEEASYLRGAHNLALDVLTKGAAIAEFSAGEVPTGATEYVSSSSLSSVSKVDAQATVDSVEEGTGALLMDMMAHMLNKDDS